MPARIPNLVHRAARGTIGAALLATTSGCLVPAHHDLSTPLDAVLTYQAAFARDDEESEYRCLSRRLVAELGANLQIYATLRPRLFEPLGSMGRFLFRRNSLRDNLAGARPVERQVHLWFSMLGQGFVVPLTTEPRAVLAAADGQPTVEVSIAVDGFVPTSPGPDGSPRATVRLEIPAALLRRLENHGVGSFEVRQLWKIDGPLLAISEPSSFSGSSLAFEPRERETVTSPGRIGWRLVERVLADSVIELTLPLAPQPWEALLGSWPWPPVDRCYRWYGPGS